jgi:hypothetical protein
MIKSFRHKGLELFFRRGSKAGIQPQHVTNKSKRYPPVAINGNRVMTLEGAEMWLAMQTNFDLWNARKRPPKVKRLSETQAA